MTISLVSLAGIPPLAGFFGKFLLLKAVIEPHGPPATMDTIASPSPPWLGVVISLYYYFGVIKTMYWNQEAKDLSTIELSAPAMLTAWICIGGIFWVGLFPTPSSTWPPPPPPP